MAIRTYKVTLDSTNRIAPETIFLRQGDKTGAVVIDATLTDNGVPVSLSGLTPMFRANTADGKAVIADGGGFSYVNAAGGELTYQVPNALASVPGKIKNAYFSLSDANGSESTFSIPFTVLPAAYATKPGALDYITIVDGTNSDIQAIINSYNIVPNGRFQEGISGSVVPSVAGVSVSQVNVDGANWAKAVSPSGTVNNQGLGMIVPRLNKAGEAMIGSGTYRVSFRLFSWANQTLKVTIIPRDASGNWLPSFDVGSFSASSNRNMRINDSVRLDVSGSEKDFLIMVWNTNSQPVNFAATDFTMIKEDDVVTGSDLESGYIEAANRDNLFENSFFTEGTTPWQKGGTDVDFRNELYADKKWLHVWTGGHTGQSVSYLGNAGTELVSGIQNTGVHGSFDIKFNIASVIDVHAIFRDAKGTVLDDMIVNTVKSRDLTIPTKVDFFIPRIARPDLSSVLITLKDHYSAALDFYIKDLLAYPVQMSKSDRLSSNVVEDPELKTGATYFQTYDGGSYYSSQMFNRRWVMYSCPAAKKLPTSRLEYRFNNEETTNDDFRQYNIFVTADVYTKNAGTYTVNAASYDQNNIKVRDYVITSLYLDANVVNHIDFVIPRMQPDEFSIGFGLCSSSTGDLSYSMTNISIRADVDEISHGDRFFNSQSNLPIVKIDGTFPTAKGDKTTVTVKIIKEGVTKNYFAKLSIQGDSSATYDKKNYKLKLYSDPDCTVKAKFKPSPSWIDEGTLVLKANWVDITHALNIVSAKLFAAITQNRANVNPNLLNASMFGEIQGTPALLYTNSSFHGLYTINTGKDENLFGFDDVPTNAGVLEAQNHFTDKGFGKPTIVITDDITANPDADLEVQVGTTTPEFQAATNRLAQFVSQSDDATFHDQFSQYLDLESVIDFLIFFQVAAMSDSYDKNIEYTTYDGNIWLTIPYDLDSTFGLNWDGKTEFDPETDMFATGLTSKDFANFKINKLLNRTLNAFKPEIKARYQELRSTVLTQDRVINLFSEFMNEIGQYNYNREADRWPGIPSKFFTFQKLRSNIIKRFKVSDFIFKRI